MDGRRLSEQVCVQEGLWLLIWMWAEGMVGTAIREMGYVLKSLNFICKLSGDSFNQKRSHLHFRVFFLARV